MNRRFFLILVLLIVFACSRPFLNQSSPATGFPSTTASFQSGSMDGQITSLEGQYSIDPRRIYTTGISNGGGMTDRVGCTMADIIAAIAPDTGVQLTMVMIFCDDHHE